MDVNAAILELPSKFPDFHFDHIYKNKHIEIINRFLTGRHTLGVLPHGYGKSTIYLNIPLTKKHNIKVKQTINNYHTTKIINACEMGHRQS